ncbi:23S rRNA (pseudouridine(1915)-N(3))-methyltransferase RlmH [Halocella sp. SP3-1]|uniref:23S rRNA (pseudouridine(1915)-N(3))-methyltransferase RlmH n=1 Tax=Halocella sp. SP3-1 TaxID=2382161 RepID=UPI000F759704|nr:23S rRNA (pseudouridine(1915)-N(3))-methyltransferase RlmH [Halocella sp. SP3-1]AZO93711.1 23S rRNA (pseudouridine(1915)-N(3))-methyltransferase RlmH [Halocella sp. SP3-1]
MEINIICPGKVKEDYLQIGINEFIKRLQPYTGVNIREVADEKIPANPSEADLERVKDKEGKGIITALADKTYIIVLDVKGKPMTSPGLAKSIQNLQLNGRSSISFVIGGALGLSKHVLKKADYRLSLSHMTFTHQMVRLILLEQVYRAFKIIRGEPYHL